jgi:transcriptional regulator
MALRRPLVPNLSSGTCVSADRVFSTRSNGMYIPASFAQTDSRQLWDLIESHSFGVLVSTVDGAMTATHLPLLLRREPAPHGRLIGHMARANPQWREIDSREVLCIFSGPHAYVSPSWYESANVVPTWNYVAVHVYGTCRVIDDAAVTARIVSDYVTTYEKSMPSPWQLETGTPFLEKLLQAIVGFEIEIDRIEGKWKLSQNQPAGIREKAAAQLAKRDDAEAQEVARLMREAMEF